MSSINTSLIHQQQIEDQTSIIKIRWIIFGWILLPMAMIGVALNSFNIVVLLHPKMRIFSTNAYLTALSLANIISLFNSIFLYSIRYILSYETFLNNMIQMENYRVTQYESLINLVLRYWSPIYTTFQLFAIYMTCAVTIDRWLYLTFPLKVDTLCTMKNTIKSIGIIFIFCVMYTLPKWFEVNNCCSFSFNFT
jgi:hypothetical protein